MEPASASKIYSSNQPRTGERASVRIVLLTLISFLLGVAATAFWFHLAAKRNAENPTSPTITQSSSEQTAVPGGNTQSSVAMELPVDPAAMAEVKSAIPNFASISVDDGTRILRQAALNDFAAAAKEMDAQVKKAQQKLSEAENGQSAAEQQAAMKQLQQTQTAATEKLQQIAARLQAQIAALKKLKSEQ
jgi:hypothetical protein